MICTSGMRSAVVVTTCTSSMWVAAVVMVCTSFTWPTTDSEKAAGTLGTPRGISRREGEDWGLTPKLVTELTVT
jgi:hypothetical protein